MIKRLLLLLFILPVLTQCADHVNGPKRIILKHPETYDFQKCGEAGVDKWKREEAKKDLDECVEKYKKLGYQVWGQR